MTNLLITGGTGFIGKALTNKLAWKYCLTSLGRKDKINKKSTTVVHLAANLNFYAPYQDLYQANVSYTKKTIDSLPYLKHFIYISTIEAYNPQTNYAKTKREAELLVENKSREKNFSATILRLGNVYGPTNPFILENLRQMDNPGNYLRIFWPYFKDVKLELIYIDNVIEVIEEVLQKKISGNFYILPPKTKTLEEIWQELRLTLKLNIQPNYKRLIGGKYFLKLRQSWHQARKTADTLDYLQNKSLLKLSPDDKIFKLKKYITLPSSINRIYQKSENITR